MSFVKVELEPSSMLLQVYACDIIYNKYIYIYIYTLILCHILKLHVYRSSIMYFPKLKRDGCDCYNCSRIAIYMYIHMYMCTQLRLLSFRNV